MTKRVLIAGGGERVIALIDILIAMKGIVLECVCDTMPDSAVVKHARQLSLDVSSDLAKLIARKKPDIIIDASGSSTFKKVLSRIRDKRFKVIDSDAAQFLMDLALELPSREKEIDRMKSEFISTTSHELRTPLAAIKEAVMLVLDGTAGTISKQQERFLSISRRNIDRLTNLISDLLDLSKIDSGKMILNKTPCDIRKIIQKALQPMFIFAEENKVGLKANLDSVMPAVQCDAAKITQVAWECPINILVLYHQLFPLRP